MIYQTAYWLPNLFKMISCYECLVCKFIITVNCPSIIVYLGFSGRFVGKSDVLLFGTSAMSINETINLCQPLCCKQEAAEGGRMSHTAKRALGDQL